MTLEMIWNSTASPATKVGRVAKLAKRYANFTTMDPRSTAAINSAENWGKTQRVKTA